MKKLIENLEVRSGHMHEASKMDAGNLVNKATKEANKGYKALKIIRDLLIGIEQTKKPQSEKDANWVFAHTKAKVKKFSPKLKEVEDALRAVDDIVFDISKMVGK